MKQSIGPYHFLANLVNPKYMSKKLNEDEIGEAMDLLGNNYPNSISNLFNFTNLDPTLLTLTPNY